MTFSTASSAKAPGPGSGRSLGKFEDGLITVVVKDSWIMKVERGYGRVDNISVRPGDILLLPKDYGKVTLSGGMVVSVEQIGQGTDADMK